MTLFNVEFPGLAFRTQNVRAVPTRAPNYAEVAAVERRAHALRAAALSDLVRAAFAGVGRLARRVGRALGANGEKARECAVLARMNDHELADIGLTRADVWRLAR